MSDEKCGATLVYERSGFEYTCVLDRGHEGMHQDTDGDLWTIRFPDETPKLSPAYVHGALDSLRGRIERLEDWREQAARPVTGMTSEAVPVHPAYRVRENEYDVVTALNSILVVLKDIRKAI